MSCASLIDNSLESELKTSLKQGFDVDLAAVRLTHEDLIYIHFSVHRQPSGLAPKLHPAAPPRGSKGFLSPQRLDLKLDSKGLFCPGNILKQLKIIKQQQVIQQVIGVLTQSLAELNEQNKIQSLTVIFLLCSACWRIYNNDTTYYSTHVIYIYDSLWLLWIKRQICILEIRTCLKLKSRKMRVQGSGC